ncbi:MAG TPA: hypothetical protein PK677_11325 [Acidiphilium sp.]|nr:hypothetical protein [Acidiphilium sp.]
MITMTLSSRADGTDTAAAMLNGETLTASSRNGAAMKLARLMVERGAPDRAVAATWGKGVAWTHPSLHGLAKQTVREGELSPRIAVFVPFEPEAIGRE